MLPKSAPSVAILTARLMMLQEHEPVQLGSEVTLDARRQGRHQGAPVRGQPTLAAIAVSPRDPGSPRRPRWSARTGSPAVGPGRRTPRSPLNREPGGAVIASTRSSCTTRLAVVLRTLVLRFRLSARAVVACAMPDGLILGRCFKPFSRATSSRSAARKPLKFNPCPELCPAYEVYRCYKSVALWRILSTRTPSGNSPRWPENSEKFRHGLPRSHGPAKDIVNDQRVNI